MANQPNMNSQPGRVLTYNGSTLDKSWEYLGVAMSARLATLPTSAGTHGTWWNNGGVPTYVA
jgi:hypothetical protein